jgi:hypothetical protein
MESPACEICFESAILWTARARKFTVRAQAPAGNTNYLSSNANYELAKAQLMYEKEGQESKISENASRGE